MEKKVTWSDIYKDFRQRHPTLRKEVIDHRPYNYLQILITCKDGMKLVYDYAEKRAFILSR